MTTDLNCAVNQKYKIHATTTSIDLSKLELRYEFDTNHQTGVRVFFDNAALQLNIAPYYLDISSHVHTELIHTADSDYFSIKFLTSNVLKKDTGNIRISLWLSNRDGSPINQVENTELSVFYDGCNQANVTSEPCAFYYESSDTANVDYRNQSIYGFPVNPYDMPPGILQLKQNVNYGKTTKISFYSKITGTYRKCNIITPANYSSERNYPVLYLLHGIGGTEDEWLGGGCATLIGNMIAKNIAKEMIVVVPNARACTIDSVPEDMNENIETFDQFIKVLKTDLIPYVNNHYSVLTGTENTAIAGLSMGGRESLFIGFSMTDTFGYIGAFSPAPGLLPDTDLDYCGQFLPDDFKLPENKPTPKMIMLCNGDSDSVVHKIPDYYHSVLERNGVQHLWYTMYGDHNFDVWDNGLYQFVKRIF